MRKHVIALIIIISALSTFRSFAQSVGINSTGNAPDPSAMLDVNSTSKGFLPPRMTEAERSAMTPVEGLMIYNLTTHKVNVFNGSLWMNTDGSYACAAGDRCQGGVIAYVFQSGDPGYVAGEAHGLIAAPTDQSTGIQWYNGANIITNATATALCAGSANTAMIITAQGIGGYAAYLCDTLTLNGYDDWYLPSKDELKKLYTNRVIIGGFTLQGYPNFPRYWSSSEGTNTNNDPWITNFQYGDSYSSSKNRIHYVRAVRRF